MLFHFMRFHLRELVSARSLIFFLLILIVTAFLFSAIPSLQTSADRINYNLSISIVDPDRGAVSQSLAVILGSMNNMGEVYLDTMDLAQERLKNNEILMIVEMPAGFSKASETLGQRPPLFLWVNERMPSETAIFVRALRGFGNSVAGIQAAYAAYADLIQPLYPDKDLYDQELRDSFSQIALWVLTRRAVITLEETAAMSTPLHVVNALVCLLGMQTGLLLLTQAQDERASGVMHRLALSRAPWWASPLSRLLVTLLWALVSFAPLVTGLTLFYPEARLSLILPAILWLYAVTSLLCLSAGYLFGRGRMVMPLVWLLILALLLLGGCVYPKALLPGVLKPFLFLSPAYWAYETVYAGLQGGALPPGAWVAGLAMLGACALLLFAAWRTGLRSSREGVA